MPGVGRGLREVREDGLAGSIGAAAMAAAADSANAVFGKEGGMPAKRRRKSDDGARGGLAIPNE